MTQTSAYDLSTQFNYIIPNKKIQNVKTKFLYYENH